jgi:ribosomal protein S18 acetylase RimI-like enzyme
MQFVRVDGSNLQKVQRFLCKAGSSLETFRYFSARPLSVVNHHLCTWLIEDDDQVEGYGHLDQDGGDVWLGVAITESSRGKGLGRAMMQRLVESADELGLRAVRLSVDNSNTVAIRLYESFDFKLVVREERMSFYERKGKALSIPPRSELICSTTKQTD